MVKSQIANFIHGHYFCHLTSISNFEMEIMGPLSISTLQELFKGIYNFHFNKIFYFHFFSQKFGTIETFKFHYDFYLECLGFTSFTLSHTCESVFKSQDIIWVYIFFHTLSYYCKPRAKVTKDIFNIYK